MQLKCVGVETYSQVLQAQLKPWEGDDSHIWDHILLEPLQLVEQETHLLHLNQSDWLNTEKDNSEQIYTAGQRRQLQAAGRQ